MHKTQLADSFFISGTRAVHDSEEEGAPEQKYIWWVQKTRISNITNDDGYGEVEN